MIHIPLDMLFFFEVACLLLFLVTLYRGYQRGFLLQIVDLTGSLVALFAGWVLAPVFVRIFTFVDFKSNGSFLISNLISNQLNRLIWMLILFVVFKLVSMLVTPLAKAITKLPLIKQVNSWIGGVFSVLVFGIQLVFIVFILTTPLFGNGQEVIDSTFLTYVDQAIAPLSSSLDQVIARNSGLQSILFHNTLSPDQEEAMYQWLVSRGFGEIEIREFLQKYE